MRVLSMNLGGVDMALLIMAVQNDQMAQRAKNELFPLNLRTLFGIE